VKRRGVQKGPEKKCPEMSSKRKETKRPKKLEKGVYSQCAVMSRGLKTLEIGGTERKGRRPWRAKKIGDAKGTRKKRYLAGESAG